MRLLSRSILALAAVSFLSITLSGLHLHADIGGHDASVSHAQDLHQAVEHDLDHDADHVDVSVFEPARGFSKVETIAPIFVLPELAAQPVIETVRFQAPPRLAPRQYSYLRQPARAPPISA